MTLSVDPRDLVAVLGYTLDRAKPPTHGRAYLHT
jgi:hypothetical protein